MMLGNSRKLSMRVSEIPIGDTRNDCPIVTPSQIRRLTSPFSTPSRRPPSEPLQSQPVITDRSRTDARRIYDPNKCVLLSWVESCLYWEVLLKNYQNPKLLLSDIFQSSESVVENEATFSVKLGTELDAK